MTLWLVLQTHKVFDKAEHIMAVKMASYKSPSIEPATCKFC